MVPDSRKQHSPFRNIFRNMMPLILLLGLVFSSNVFGTDKYRVYTRFIHLGETIANPMLEVAAGETTGGTYSAKGHAEYKVVVLVREAAENEVSISLQFTSGNINIQPNLLVELDKEISRTFEDKIVLELLVQKISQ